MTPSRRHRLFQWAVAVKGIDGMLEVAGGALLILFGAHGVSGAVAFLTQHELAEDPRDLFANYLVRHTERLGVASVHVAAAYLLVHGLAKIGLAAGLLRDRRGIFPVALAFLGLFFLYQVYRMIIDPSAALGVLILLDAVILVLVWKEYLAMPPEATAQNDT